MSCSEANKDDNYNSNSINIGTQTYLLDIDILTYT